MPKIAITTEGPSLQDMIDSRFGRAAGFLVVDTETMHTEYADNGASQVMAQGAGINATELLAATGATILLTGVVGPKAAKALEAAGITFHEGYENITAQEALDRFTTQ